MPHEYETWLDVWHTMPNGDPPRPFADDTELRTLMRMPPVLATEEFALFTTESGKEIAFHEVLPLHADELALKLAEGTDALIDRLDAAGVQPIVDPARPSCGGVGLRPPVPRYGMAPTVSDSCPQPGAGLGFLVARRGGRRL